MIITPEDRDKVFQNAINTLDKKNYHRLKGTVGMIRIMMLEEEVVGVRSQLRDILLFLTNYYGIYKEVFDVCEGIEPSPGLD